MKIEPVFLLAPKPPRPSVPRRRALLMAAAGLLGGVGLGVLGTKWVLASNAGEVGIAAPDDGLEWIRGICRDESRLGELVRCRASFMTQLERFPDDSDLRDGLERIVGEVAHNPQLPDRRQIASQVLERLDRWPHLGRDLDTSALAALRATVEGR